MAKNVKKVFSKLKKIRKKKKEYSKNNNYNKIKKENEDDLKNIIENKANNKNELEIEFENENNNMIESDIENISGNESEKENELMIKKETNIQKLKKGMKNALKNNLKSNKITYFKELLKFILNEYSGSWINGFYSIVFNLPLLKSLKNVYYVGLTLYNYFVNRNKAIATLILLCINNI